MHRRQIACSAAVGLGAVVACFVLWPGTMNVDAFIQLEEGRTGLYYGWHPPLMGWLWSRLDRVIPGPGGMLLFHHAMFWSGLGLVVYHYLRSPAASAATILVVGAMPPVLSALGTIWKDVSMGAALLLAFGLLLHVHRRHSTLWLVPAVASLFYATGIRYNALFAAMPMCLWLGFVLTQRFLPGTKSARLVAAALGFGTLVVLGGINWTITRRLVDNRRTYPTHQVMVHDLMGITVRTGSVALPTFLADTALPPSAIQCLYSTNSAVTAFSGLYGRCPITLRKLTRASEVAALRTAWLGAIREEPAAYVAHRLAVWRDLLAIGTESVYYPLQTGIPGPNKLGIDTRLSGRHERARHFFGLAAHQTPLFRAWPYLLIMALVLVGGIRRTVDPVPLLVLGSSALLYELAYLPIGTGTAFRFNWWPIIASLASMAMVVPPREFRAARDQPSASTA